MSRCPADQCQPPRNATYSSSLLSDFLHTCPRNQVTRHPTAKLKPNVSRDDISDVASAVLARSISEYPEKLALRGPADCMIDNVTEQWILKVHTPFSQSMTV
mmetsp:Transcript_126401/g.236242  ORF Transcript_126401/g.236242 Transcript_126401/m.236242 type:complete len:102 (+) Transcript_126401:126-431(+)